MMRAEGRRRWQHDWLSEEWRWGYGQGAAHDAAKELRTQLVTIEARKTWLKELKHVPWDEVQLCLALRIQRSMNRRHIPYCGGTAEILTGMAQGKFGSGNAPDDGLVSALKNADLPTVEHKSNYASVENEVFRAVDGDDARTALVKVLLALRFIDDGL